MREFTKAFFSYSLALSLFGVKQMANILTPAGRYENRGKATKAFGSLTNATTDQFDETLQSTFRALDKVQRGVINLAFSFTMPSPARGQESGGREYEPEGLKWSSEPQRWTDVMPEEAPGLQDDTEAEDAIQTRRAS